MMSDVENPQGAQPEMQAGMQSGMPDERLNISYFKQKDGVIKLTEAFCSILTFICAIAWSGFTSMGGGWVQFVSMTAFLITVILIAIYFFFLYDKLPAILHKEIAEMIYCVVVTICYFIAFLVAAVKGSHHSAIGAAAFFSFVCMGVYGFDAFLRLRAYNRGEKMDGSPMVANFTNEDPNAIQDPPPYQAQGDFKSASNENFGY